MALLQQLTILEHHGLLTCLATEPEAQYMFRHELGHEAVYTSLLKSDRKKIHLAVAQALERLYPEPPPTVAAELAHHYARTDETTKAIDYLLLAGQHALQISALREAQRWLEQALALLLRTEIDPPTLRRAQILQALGETHFQLGHYPEARQHLEASLALSQTLQAVAESIDTQQVLGNVLWSLGEYPLAHAHLAESLRQAEASLDRGRMAQSLRGLGMLAWSEGHYAEARTQFEASLHICRDLNEPWGVARALNNVGTAILSQGDYVGAKGYYEEGLVLARRLGAQRLMSNCLNNLGLVAENLKQFTEAQFYYTESLRLDQQMGDEAGVALTLSNLGDIARQLGQEAEAWRCFHASLRANLQAGAIPSALFVLSSMAYLIAKAGRPEEALELWGLVQHHPAHKAETTQQVEGLVTELRATLPPATATAALARGAQLDFETTVANMLAEAERWARG